MFIEVHANDGSKLSLINPPRPGGRFFQHQNGYVYGSVNIPVSNKTPNGMMKTAYGAGFDGIFYMVENWGILTHFSLTYQPTTIDNLTGKTTTFWFMPGAAYEYVLKSTYQQRIAVNALAMAGVGILKPLSNLKPIGTSGSPGFGVGIGGSINALSIGFKYMYYYPSFTYTIYPDDFIDSKLKGSYFQVSVGYTFEFYPKRRPK